MLIAGVNITFNEESGPYYFTNKIFSKIYKFIFSFLILDPTNDAHLNVGMQNSMRLFRAQRNFYISGFAIFLSLVIRRLVILISGQATLLAQSEASFRQAKSATSAAQSLLNQQKELEKAGVDPEKVKESQEQEKLVNLSIKCLFQFRMI